MFRPTFGVDVFDAAVDFRRSTDAPIDDADADGRWKMADAQNADDVLRNEVVVFRVGQKLKRIQ